MSKAKTILSVVVAAGLIISAAALTSHAISGISADEARPKTETASTPATLEMEDFDFASAATVYVEELASQSEKAKIRKIIRERREELKTKEYDVLACLTKYDPGTHEDFCADFGYDTDSIRGLKTYLAVQKEYYDLRRIFTPEQLEAMQEIS